jgi:hypothetical protein
MKYTIKKLLAVIKAQQLGKVLVSMDLVTLHSVSGIDENDIKSVIKPNFVARVRERTIPTERQLLVGEVSVNFYVVRLTDPFGPYSLQSRPEPLLFFQVSPQLYPRG